MARGTGTVDAVPRTGDGLPGRGAGGAVGGVGPMPPQQLRNNETWRVSLRRHWRLYTFVVLPVIFLLVFRYVPMIGNVIAFRRYRPGGSMFGDEWVGLYYFQMFIGSKPFWDVFWNTVVLGGLTLAICFPLPIVLAR